MSQASEDVPFAPESLFAGAAHDGNVQQLDCGASFEAPVAALRQPDGAHPALADERQQPVRAKDESRQRWRGEHPYLDNAVEKPRGFNRFVFAKKHLQMGGNVGIPRAERCQPRRPLLPVQLQRLVQVRTHPSPEVGIKLSHAVAF